MPEYGLVNHYAKENTRMKTGKTIEQLWLELDRQQQSKHDALVRTNTIRSETGGWGSQLYLEGDGRYDINEHAHTQIAQHLRIPKAYYDRMRYDQPALFDSNVNTWMEAAPPDQKRLVRTLDGKARAFLSNGYRILDNIDLMRFLMPEFAQYQDLQVLSSEVTERNLYLKLALPRLTREIALNDVVQMGVVFRNSEVSAGALSAMPFLFRLKCLNGMVVEEYGKRRHHVGRRLELEDGEDVMTIYSDEAKQADDRALFLKMRDVARAVLTEVTLDKVVNKIQQAEGIEVVHPDDDLEVIAQKEGLTEEERKTVLGHLIRDGGSNLWEFANAFTRAASDMEDYERATEFEVMGGKLIDLSRTEWRDLTNPTSKKSTTLALAVA
jgi:hypothetical protein